MEIPLRLKIRSLILQRNMRTVVLITGQSWKRETLWHFMPENTEMMRQCQKVMERSQRQKVQIQLQKLNMRL